MYKLTIVSPTKPKLVKNDRTFKNIRLVSLGLVVERKIFETYERLLMFYRISNYTTEKVGNFPTNILYIHKIQTRLY